MSHRLRSLAFVLMGSGIGLILFGIGVPRVRFACPPAPPGRIEAKEFMAGADFDVQRYGYISEHRYLTFKSTLSVAPHWFVWVRRGEDVACYEVPEAAFSAAKVGEPMSAWFDDSGWRSVDRPLPPESRESDSDGHGYCVSNWFSSKRGR